MKIIAPWRIWNLKSREEEIEYAEAHNIPLNITRETNYSKDKNICTFPMRPGSGGSGQRAEI